MWTAYPRLGGRKLQVFGQTCCSASLNQTVTMGCVVSMKSYFINSNGSHKVNKEIALWDKSICVKNWSSDMKSILLSINKLNEFETLEALNINGARNLLIRKMNEKWKTDILSKPKLRTYVTFKSVLQTEEYLRNNISRHKRSLLAQLRLGILPLEIKVGRFRNIPVENRLCKCCDTNVVKNEFHFVCECVTYPDLRTVLYSQHITSPPILMYKLFFSIL